VEKLRRTAALLLGKLTFTYEVANLTLTTDPLREWQHGARQLSLLDTVTPPKLAQLRSVIRVLQQRFGETVIRLASLVGPSLGIGWGGWSSRVTNANEYWREHRPGGSGSSHAAATKSRQRVATGGKSHSPSESTVRGVRNCELLFQNKKIVSDMIFYQVSVCLLSLSTNDFSDIIFTIGIKFHFTKTSQ